MSLFEALRSRRCGAHQAGQINQVEQINQVGQINQVKQVKQLTSYKLKYRPELDGLRALAVLSVVVFHFFPTWLSSGYLGVDIFFVISGFLITSQLIGAESPSIKETLRSFYKKRAARLFPALFLCLLLTYLFVKLFFIANDVSRFERSLVSAYTFWSNVYFWRDGGYFGGNDQLKPLLHIWSLSVEEQFYMSSPVAVLLLLKLGRGGKKALFFGLLGAVALSFLLWSYLNHIGGRNPAFFLLPTRVWQFGLGALIAVRYDELAKLTAHKSAKQLLLPLSLLLILVGLFSSIGPQTQTVLVSLGAVGFIAFTDNERSLFVKVFRAKPAVFFGRLSYSLYLYHWPIAVALTYYFIDHVPVEFSLLGIIMSVLLGWFSFSLVENKFRYSKGFSATLLFLFSCVVGSLSLSSLDLKTERSPLAHMIAQASGTHYRCELASYQPYGSSRACLLKKAKRGQNTIVLLGNSHAQMYAPMLQALDLEDKQLLLVPLNGCLPTTSINISSKCLQMAQENLSTVLADSTVTTIVIGTTWYAKKYVDQGGASADPDELYADIVALINRVKGSGKRPVLLSPLPIPNRDYASELARSLHFKKITTQDALTLMRAPRAVFDQQFSRLNDDLSKMLGDSYIRIYDELCDQEFCYYGRGDAFYFADGNHLSQQAVVNFHNAKQQLRKVLDAAD